MRYLKVKTLLFFGTTLVLSGVMLSAYAQNFDVSSTTSSQQLDVASVPNGSDTKNSSQVSSLETNVNPSDEDDSEDVFIPEDELYRLNTPTVDGSQRGGEAFVMQDEDGRLRKVTNIFLFYDDFKINHSFGNFTSCDVRFNILSNLDRKLSQLDVKLVWPKMTTTLSFSNVSPFNQLYINYTLLGEGCYSMDKSPNIVVNRCRAKGMTAVECAKKIIWVHQ